MSNWLADKIAEKLSENIEEDRILIIPDRDDQIGYIDTESCTVYLITVEEARLVPTQAATQDGEDAQATKGTGI